MPQNDVVITIGSDSAQLTSGLSKAQSQIKTFGESVDRSGRQAMIGLRSVSEGIDLIGGNTGFSQAARQAAMMADTVGDITGALVSMSPALAGLTVAAGVFAIIKSKADEADAAIKKQTQSVVDLRAELEKIRAQRQFTEQIGFSADELKRYAQTSLEAEQATIDLTDKLKARAEAQARVDNINRLNQNKDFIGGGVQLFRDVASGIPTLQQYQQDLIDIDNLTNQIAADGNKVKQSLDAQKESADRLAASLAKANSGAFSDARDLRNSDATKKAAFEANSVDAQLATEGWRKVAAAQDKFTESLQNVRDVQASVGASLARNLSNLARDYNKQVAQFAKEETRIYADEAKARTQIERDSQKELANIEKERAKSLAQVNKDEAKSLADVDRQLASSLRTARSARDRREARRAAAERKVEIVQQAAERRAEINAQAEERKQAALEAKAERLQQIAEQRQERLVELAEKKKLAAEEYAFRRAEATRAANEQIAAARQAAQKMYSELQTAMNNQNRLVGASVARLGSDLSVQARNLGVNISNGIASGIASGQISVTNAVLGVARAALGTAKASLGISSPSRVFAESVGKPMAQGIAQGFKNQVGAQTFALSFNHTWQGNTSAIDRGEIARIAQDAAYNGVHIALRGGANG